LSLWSWQDAIKAVFLDRREHRRQYDKAVHSPSLEMMLPSVVSLKTYVKPSTHPAFTRFNVFLRDKFCCQFCGSRDDLTFDHLVRARTAARPCGAMSSRPARPQPAQGSLTMAQAGMYPSQMPFQPSVQHLHRNGPPVPAELSAR